jgi:hypothetical protein
VCLLNSDKRVSAPLQEEFGFSQNFQSLIQSHHFFFNLLSFLKRKVGLRYHYAVCACFSFQLMDKFVDFNQVRYIS